VTGKKADLIASLEEAMRAEAEAGGGPGGDALFAEVDHASEETLRQMCIARCLDSHGTLEELRQRYKADMLYTSELKEHKARQQQQQQLPPLPPQPSPMPAALGGRVTLPPVPVSPVRPPRKWMEITIRGLGMAPTKTTGAGEWQRAPLCVSCSVVA
jgi:hypothetical protein